MWSMGKTRNSMWAWWTSSSRCRVGPKNQEGGLVRVLSKGAMEEPNGIAIDPESGRVYIADEAKGAVYEYSVAVLMKGR